MSPDNNYFVVEGKYNKAKVFSIKKDKGAFKQIKKICDNPVYRDAKIRIMPDYHKGMGTVIGFTATLGEKVVPNAVGVDINCGMYTVYLGKLEIDLPQLDKFIKSKIPSGFKKNKVISKNIDDNLRKNISRVCQKLNLNTSKQLKGIGSLGGGNHFIEINEDNEGGRYLVIHTGSRNFGFKVCQYHQNKADGFLKGRSAKEYFADMKVAQQYADANRKEIARRITDYLGPGLDNLQTFQTRHNYIDFKDEIIRKGAVSAHKGEKLLIPLNMRDGSILARGLGNEDWNYSAPHGAGRVMSRRQAKKSLSLGEYRKAMKEVYTTSVKKSTLDEAPFAYKSAQELFYTVKETLEIIEVLKPIYNFKAS